VTGSAWAERLPAWSIFGAVLSAAGLPIYIYAPKFYADSYGVSLASLGAVLFVLRMFDMVQDPALGWIAERLDKSRGPWVVFGGAVMALSMVGMFAVTPLFTPVLWFALTAVGLFSAFSFLTILFYSQGVAKAGAEGQVRLAAWRESGALLGVCLAAVAPTLLAGVTPAPFAVFAYGFAVAVAVAVVAMAPEWGGRIRTEPVGFRVIFADPQARRLLQLALVNATPLAVSSTLFLFFVDGRLGAAGWEGPLLVLFFLSAALSAPGWSYLAGRFGAKPVLLIAMVLAILSFGWAITLGTGDVILFAGVCVVSGATIGADLTLLPALFARRMAAVSPNGGQGFGLWSLMNKFTLAFAAVALLPLLEWAGFRVGAEDNSETALLLLSVLYAGVPTVLKLLAIGMLIAFRLED
jgi:GPH family glycoside/pentoside/hexuronide:cation symporter